ncbi:MAG: YcxB family protein [Methylobacillus sp.]|nr:YcxB family protein [Methylobacillus sp.]
MTETTTSPSAPSRSATVQLTPADYLAASRLHARRQLCKGRNIFIWSIIVLVVLVVLVSSTATSAQFWNALLRFFAIFLVIFASFYALAYAFVIPYQVRKIFREQKSLQVPYTWTWSEQGFEIQSDKYGRGTYPWSDLFNWEEDQRMLIFYHSSRLFHMLPHRALNEAQADDLRHCIKAARNE